MTSIGEDSAEVANNEPVTTEKVKKLSEAKQDSSGIVYMSRVPPQMTPSQVRSLLSILHLVITDRYGEIGRVYLTAEASTKTQKMHRKGCFVDGWIEFKDKKIAKSVAEMLNGKIIGGKKMSRFHDDLWNLKYLKGFKWHNLTDKFTYRNAVKDQKLRVQMEMDRKDVNSYIKNFEKSKIAEKKEEKKRKNGEEEDVSVKKHSIRQRKAIE